MVLKLSSFTKKKWKFCQRQLEATSLDPWAVLQLLIHAPTPFKRFVYATQFISYCKISFRIVRILPVFLSPRIYLIIYGKNWWSEYTTAYFHEPFVALWC